MQSLQDVHIVTGLPIAADRYNTNPAGDVVDLGNYSDFMALLDETSAGTNTGTVKITIEACDDFVPTNTVQVPFKYQVCTSGDTWGALTDATAAGGYTTTADADGQKVKAFVRAADLPEGYRKLRAKLTEVTNDPCTAGLSYFLSGNRYAQAIPETAIA